MEARSGDLDIRKCQRATSILPWQISYSSCVFDEAALSRGLANVRACRLAWHAAHDVRGLEAIPTRPSARRIIHIHTTVDMGTNVTPGMGVDAESLLRTIMEHLETDPLCLLVRPASYQATSHHAAAAACVLNACAPLGVTHHTN